MEFGLSEIYRRLCWALMGVGVNDMQRREGEDEV